MIGIFESTHRATRTYDCDGWNCEQPVILRGERYRRLTVAPWADGFAGVRQLQPDGTWKELAWLTFHVHVGCKP